MIEQNGQTLENGSIYFFYRSFIDEEDNCSDGIQRFYMVLNPVWQRQYRVMMLGKKKPRRRRPESPNMWGVVRRMAANPEQIEIEIDAKGYHTKTRRERQLKAPRLVGHGLYRILRRQDDTHLVYSLQMPRKQSEFVPRDFEIAPEADYVLKIKNPDRPFPPGFGLEEQQVQYPRPLQMLFEDRHFSKADPPELLNYEGTGVLLTAADAASTDQDDEETCFNGDGLSAQDFMADLRREKMQCRLEPLFAGSKF
jgi:hypothetical protein